MAQLKTGQKSTRFLIGLKYPPKLPRLLDQQERDKGTGINIKIIDSTDFVISTLNYFTGTSIHKGISWILRHMNNILKELVN